MSVNYTEYPPEYQIRKTAEELMRIWIMIDSTNPHRRVTTERVPAIKIIEVIYEIG